MTRSDYVSLALTSQMLLGFMAGPAIAFQRIYGHRGLIVFLAICAFALIVYALAMVVESRRGAWHFSFGRLRAGVLSTIIFSIVGMALAAPGLMGLPQRILLPTLGERLMGG